MSNELSPNPFYTTDYRRHLAATQDYLIGADSLLLPPSYIPPTGYWSPSEKGLFFHALSVHSRLRPDLIAACVPSKTVVDVCAYIDALEVASSLVAPPNGDARRGFPHAIEVSDEWVEREEEEAASLAVVESLWERDAVLEERAKELLALKAGKNDTQSSGLTSGEELESLLKEREIHWEREDFLCRLGETHLKVIDSLIRAAEHKSALPGMRDRDHFETPSTAVNTSPTATPSPPLDAEQLDDPGALSPASRRRYYKRLYMRRKRATQTGKAVITDIGKLKPGRRRNGRSGKESSPCRPGGSWVEETNVWNREVIEDSNECDPGEEKCVSGSNEDDAINSDQDNHHRNRDVIVSGLQPSRRLKGDFARLGVDDRILQDEGLGLIHTAALWRLMRSISTDNEVNMTISANTIRMLENIIVRFTITLIRLVIASREQEAIRKTSTKAWRFVKDQIMVGNVSHALEMMGFGELCHERKLKTGMGKGCVRAQKKSRTEFLTSESMETKEDGEDEGKDEESGTEGQSDPLKTLSLHRQIYTPLVRLLPGTSMSPNSELIPLGMDEDALINELLEEEQLDENDRELDRLYEAELWEGSAEV